MGAPASVTRGTGFRGKAAGRQPGHPGFHAPVVMQPQPAVSRRLLIGCKITAACGELYAGRWAGQQSHAFALLFELLMDMAPEHRPYPRLCVQTLPQAVGVLRAQGFHPGTADGCRMVVVTEQEMAFAGAGQCL